MSGVKKREKCAHHIFNLRIVVDCMLAKWIKVSARFVDLEKTTAITEVTGRQCHMY